jgi:hypothetical protein
VPGGQGGEDRVVEGDLSQLFPQQEVGLAVKRDVLVQHLGGEVGLDRAAVGEPPQVEGNAAAEEVGMGLIDARVAGVEAGGFPVAEGAQEDLARPPAEEGAPGWELGAQLPG